MKKVFSQDETVYPDVSRGLFGRFRIHSEQTLQKLLIWILIAVFGIGMVLPLVDLFRQALLHQDGSFAGVTNFVRYFSTPALVQSLVHTITVSTLTTVISIVLAFGYAYALHRTAVRGKSVLTYIALLPLFAPTMMHGIALTYLFGNQGVVTTGLFGLLGEGFDIGLYGLNGIVLAEVIYTFPQAFLILSVSLAVADYTLYEAAQTMGANRWTVFRTVTLPGVKYALISASFVVFTLSFTDFGAPKIVGGQYNVLATDIYKQVIGQQNMTMGATIGLLLTIPAVIAFVVDRIAERKQKAYIGSRSTAYQIKSRPWRDRMFQIYCTLIALSILLLIGAVFLAAFAKTWPYDLTLTFDNFDFSRSAGEGLTPYINSVWVAVATAVIGTVFTFMSAYVLEKTRVLPGVRQIGYFLSIIPLALPGLVIGLAYIFFFNRPGNPLHILYGTGAILVLANVLHFYSVAFVTATTALKKLDKEFELVSESMRVPFYVTLFRVTIPMTLPAILEIASYYFVNAMVTISAVIFLYSTDWKLAAVSIVNMEDAGDIAPAAAMSVLILVTNMIVKVAYEWGTRALRRRTEAWKKR